MSTHGGGKRSRTPDILPQSTFPEGVQSEALRRALAQEERALVRRPYEGGVFLNTQTGQVLGRYSATADKPLKMPIPPEDAPRYEGATFTHNHPHGSTISDGDIRMAMRLNLHELRAVTDRYVYRLIMPGRLANFEIEDLDRRMGWTTALMRQELMAWKAEHPGENARPYERYLEGQRLHEFWSRLLPEYDIVYVREPRVTLPRP